MTGRIGVIIPARDEQQLVGRCLRSVIAACEWVDVPVDIVLAADGCLDRTADIAREFAAVTVIELESSNVGAARAAAARVALDLGATWLASTDADSTVPINWLAHQWLLAEQGWDVVLGTVRPDFADLDEQQRAAWLDTHPAGVANGHVHGANLGLRRAAYLSAGGFGAVAEHEDVGLIARTPEARRIASAGAEVMTSGRKFGRTPGGYARFLREGLLDRAESNPLHYPGGGAWLGR